MLFLLSSGNLISSGGSPALLEPLPLNISERETHSVFFGSGVDDGAVFEGSELGSGVDGGAFAGLGLDSDSAKKIGLFVCVGWTDDKLGRQRVVHQFEI